MSLAPLARTLDLWTKKLAATCEPLLVEARAKLFAVQTHPEAMDKIDRVEELLRARFEPIFLDAEEELEPIKEGIEAYFSRVEDARPDEDAVRERAANGVFPMRERVERRIQSLVAQARVNELLATAPGQAAAAAPAAPPPGMPRFCGACGNATGPTEWQSRACGRCGGKV